MKTSSNETVFGFGRRMRVLFLEKILADDANIILGVQTLRNEIFVGSFIAKSAFLAITVILAAASSVDLSTRLQKLNRSDLLTGHKDSAIPPSLKVALLLFLFAGVFLCAIQNLRLVRHVNMHIGCSGCESKDQIVPSVCHMYNRAAVFFWMASRQMLLSFPVAGWIWGPTSLFIASLICTAFMYIVDNLNLGTGQLEKTLSRMPSLTQIDQAYGRESARQ